MLALITGFTAGGLHVLSGPDHMAAIAPLAADAKAGGWRSGFRWGVGHSSGVFLVGMLAAVMRGLLPVPMVSTWAERFVGIFLLGIGIWSLRRALSGRLHAHEHLHGGIRHVHLHIHGEDRLPGRHTHDEAELRSRLGHSHTAFWVGTLHGVAGTSHFLGVLPSLAFPTWPGTATYLAAYGVGTVLAMVVFSAAIGQLGRMAGVRGARFSRGLMISCALVALGVGGFWLVG